MLKDSPLVIPTMEAYTELFELSTLTLSTTGQNGEPHAAPVYFAAVQNTQPGPGWFLSLYFFSDQESQHARDIAVDPRAAAALYPICEGWQDIRGLQMRGLVRVVELGAEWDRAWEQYRLKFPFVTALKAVVASNTLYAFVPQWIRLVDNRRGFGFKEEWTLA